MPSFLKILILGLAVHVFALESAAAPLAAKLCLTKTKNFVIRERCRGGETVMSLSTLSRKLFVVKTTDFVGVESEGSEVQATVEAGTPGFGGTNIPGAPLLRTANCPSGTVFSSSCESSTTTSLTIDRVEAQDGKSVRCSWSQSTLTDITGIFYVKAVCANF
ncbi:MAG: hypothetical protein RL417_2396 [Pseudomonadota bacterium]|jgi:hypothetical protein